MEYVRPSAVALALTVIGTASAQPFQLYVVETPPFQGAGQPVERFFLEASGAIPVRLDDIPAALTDDPTFAVFRQPHVVYVANRATHSGNGSISSFRLVRDDAHGVERFIAGVTLTGNGLTDVVQLAINPESGELFAPSFDTGVLSRFTFDSNGKPVANGIMSMPDSGFQLGVAFRETDGQLFVSSYDYVRRFMPAGGGSYSYEGQISIPGATSLHFISFRADEMYVCDVFTNAVYRFTFDGNGTPVANGSVPSHAAISAAFSLDQSEMFVAAHFDGGIARFRYNDSADDWDFVETLPTPPLGGLSTASATPCHADYNADGILNTSDFLAYLNAFTVVEPEADFNGDSLLNTSDFISFLNAFTEGC